MMRLFAVLSAALNSSGGHPTNKFVRLAGVGNTVRFFVEKFFLFWWIGMNTYSYQHASVGQRNLLFLWQM